MEQTQEKYYLQLIKYFTDFNVLVTTTSRKQLIVYKYNPFGCLTSIKHKKSLDSICYTQKPPILAFSGDSEDIFKWEQTQSNQLIYSSERLIKTDNVISVSSNYQGENQPTSNSQNHQEITNSRRLFFSRENSGKTILKLLFFEKYDLIFAACEDSKVYVWLVKLNFYKRTRPSFIFENYFLQKGVLMKMLLKF
jgi:WD40 repeat protein